MSKVISEVEAATSFISQFNDGDHVPFHSCSLRQAIGEACLVPTTSRKIIALYFHNENDPFSKMFCPALISGEVRNILENTFYLLGWDVSDSSYHSALKKSLKKNINLKPAECLITEKCAALLILYPIESAITVFSVMHGAKVKVEEVLATLKKIEVNFKWEIKNEIELENIKAKFQSGNDIGSREFHQLMFDRLGNRDYDCFEFDEHEHLKEKIGFAMFGPPQMESGYDDEQNKKIKETYGQIREHSNHYSEWQDQIVVSFIYNCLEPIPQEKVERSKKYTDYNPNTDITPIPIYVIRKCRGSSSKNPCRLFVDSSNRVYNTWSDYIESNKLDKCTMILPKHGRYAGNKSGQVFLEMHLSPSFGVAYTLLRGTDIAFMVAGMASGVVFTASLFSAIAVAPAVLTVASVTGLTVGVYSIIRSATNIYDRYVHSEDMSFFNTESRGAYIHIIAGTLGFVGAGATTAMSHFVARGINIGQGAQQVIQTMNVVNIGASGVGIANSTYEVYDEWYNEQQTPSSLTLIQLSSSILFFGNAVYNFKTSGRIIEETQTNVLKDYQESLKSNRQRKLLNKPAKETIRQNGGDVQAGRAEVISALRDTKNKDEIIDVLIRHNKLFNEEGVSFSTENGEIKLNGVFVDLFECGAMTVTQRTKLLLDLPPVPQPSSAVVKCNAETTLKVLSTEVENYREFSHLIYIKSRFIELAATLLHHFSEWIQKKVLQICLALTRNLFESMDFFKVFKHYFSYIDTEELAVVFEFVMDFIKTKTDAYEREYEESKLSAKLRPDFNEEDFNKQWKVHPDSAQRLILWVKKIVKRFVEGEALDKILLNELIKYVKSLITAQMYYYGDAVEKSDKREQSTIKNVHKINCPVCGGYYFSVTP